MKHGGRRDNLALAGRRGGRGVRQAEHLRVVGTCRYGELDAGTVAIHPAGTPAGDALGALGVAARAAIFRFRPIDRPWAVINIVTAGGLITPPATRLTSKDELRHHQEPAATPPGPAIPICGVAAILIQPVGQDQGAPKRPRWSGAASGGPGVASDGPVGLGVGAGGWLRASGSGPRPATGRGGDWHGDGRPGDVGLVVGASEGEGPVGVAVDTPRSFVDGTMMATT